VGASIGLSFKGEREKRRVVYTNVHTYNNGGREKSSRRSENRVLPELESEITRYQTAEKNNSK
jgi:hypothetical protein